MAEGKSNDDDPPLDDPRWLTLTMAHHTRSEQLIGKRFASLASGHLMERLKSGKLRCMRESRKYPSERERVPPSFWQNLNIDVDPDRRLIQIQHVPSIQRVSQRDLGQIHDWAFYVWKPDFDGLWPPAKADRETTEMSQRRKPGRLPTHEWPLVVAAELIRRAKAREKDPTVREMIEYCETTFPDEFSPGLKEMQLLLKKLLTGQF